MDVEVTQETTNVITDDKLAQLLERQRWLQTEKLGYDLAGMDLDERVEYLKMNVLALTDELHEMLAEMSWKPWARRNGNAFLNRDKALGEAVDALHFLNNVFLALGASPAEIADHYLAKNKRNGERQDEGYDGVAGKCATCRRALDEPGATHKLVITTADGRQYCSGECERGGRRPGA